jgi:hypothetical protein
MPQITFYPPPYTSISPPPYTVYILVWEESPVPQPAEEALSIEEIQLAELYAEFAEEDRQLAAIGLAHYAKVLREEEEDYEAR